MHSRMMDFPLTTTHLLDRANTLFPRTEVVSRAPDGSLRRSTYGEIYRRACRLAHALVRLGIKKGDRVATLAWNHDRHLEAYLAVPSMGAVLHTLNLRLHANDLAYIARHAEDSVVLVDASLLPLLKQFAPKAPSIRHIVVIPDVPTSEAGLLDYEKLLAAEAESFDFPHLDEGTAAGICYTSGTTGNPKGAVYSHRSTMLHTLVGCMSDALGISENDTVLPAVPMFHANAWGFPYMATCVGAKLVLPGPKLDPTSLLDLMVGERVTLAGGVPTIWLGILALLDEHPKRWDLSSIRTMVVGGSAAPPAMIDGFLQRHGLRVTHAWGMTETSPLGTVARVKRHLGEIDSAKSLAVRSTQGYAVPFVETRHVDDEGHVLARDGKTMGELEVRGPWVAASYLGEEGEDRFTSDGWFKTGDVVTIDAEGYLAICDRSKDVIKSGGEWISSVDLENALMSHPAVLEAAVFAGKHAKWTERPIAAVAVKPGQQVTEEQLRAHLVGRFPKFWLPDAYVFVEQVPRTSTGKFLKTKLREQYGDKLMGKS
jgi:fatty-acyl-CoA synthase